MSKKKSDGYYVLFKKNTELYSFIKINQSEDGSILIIFPEIDKGKGISQRLNLRKESSAVTFDPEILESKAREESEENVTYITYHSTGQINYHRMSFEPMYMESLSQITQLNLFFILSFQTMDAFNIINDISAINTPNCCVCDISQLNEGRYNILFSIAPTIKQPLEENATIISLNYGDVFRLMIEFIDDKQSFCFSKLYCPEDCVKLRPHIDLFSERALTKNEAYLKYQHRIYQNNSLIILAPNSEGILKIIFDVEMRKAPWVKIDFTDKNYEARDIQRNQTKLSFKVFDNKSKRYIKSTEKIQISNVILDAEIYDDESIPPVGFI